eukprot:PhF_6_TR38593/c1_g1_i2/m.57396
MAIMAVAATVPAATVTQTSGSVFARNIGLVRIVTKRALGTSNLDSKEYVRDMVSATKGQAKMAVVFVTRIGTARTVPSFVPRMHVVRPNSFKTQPAQRRDSACVETIPLGTSLATDVTNARCSGGVLTATSPVSATSMEAVIRLPANVNAFPTLQEDFGMARIAKNVLLDTLVWTVPGKTWNCQFLRLVRVLPPRLK